MLNFLSGKKGKFLHVWFLLPCFAVVLSLIVFPLIYSLSLSLFRWNLATAYLGRTWVGLGNYLSILTEDGRFWKTLTNTFLMVGLAVGAEFILGLGLALILTQRIPGRKIFSVVLLIPMMIVPVVVGMVWRLLYHAGYGPLNYFLSFFGIKEGIDWLGNPSLSLYSIIITDIWQWTPLMFLITLGGMMALPKYPYEAAQLDGASSVQIFAYVTLPLLRNIITVALLLRTIDAFKLFDKIWVLTQGGPGLTTENIPMYIYYKAFRYFDMGYASALSYILLFIVSAIASFLLTSLFAPSK